MAAGHRLPKTRCAWREDLVLGSGYHPHNQTLQRHSTHELTCQVVFGGRPGT